MADYQQWLTSDLHFFHEKVISYCPGRTRWESVARMNIGLVQLWNRRVNDNDTVWIVGDFTFKKIPLLKDLKGRKILVRGNHDSSAVISWLLREGIICACVDSVYTEFRRQKVFLTHIPKEDWIGKDTGTIQFHGHRHGGLSDRGDGWVENTPNMYDVGIDVPEHGFSPITIDEALGLVTKKNKQLLAKG